jgi:phosphonoacetaldehyde hydrolase
MTSAQLKDRTASPPGSQEREPAKSDQRRPATSALKAVIFDWAGTIVDFGSRAPVVAVRQVFEELKIPVTNAEARGPMGMAKRDHIRAILQLPRVRDAWRSQHGKLPDEAAIDHVYEVFLKTQRDVLAQHSAPIPGAREAIQFCRARKLRIGSSTGYTAELMKPLVEAARADGLELDAVLCADDVPAGRPAPWLCLENARRLGVYPMRAIVAIDDTTVGIEAGVNAGMWTIGIARSGNGVGLSESELSSLSAKEQNTLIASARTQLKEAGTHLLIDTVAELPQAVQQIDDWLAAGIRP